jgi:hypothetical protein
MTFVSQTSLPTATPDIVIKSVTCDSTVIVGDWVRMDSSGIAIKAIADGLGNSNVIGLVEEKIDSTTCNIRVLGVSLEIFTGLDVTKEYFLSDADAGEMVEQGPSVPTASGHINLKLGQPFSTTRFLVLKGMRIERS